VFGYLGPNGAGKTTTIRLMLDLLRPTSGSVSVFGADCNADGPAIRGRIGYLPGDLSLYPSFTGERILRFFGALRENHIRWDYVRDLCDRLGIELDRPTRELSHGNKQKVGIVLALMAEPDLVILDEPTNGLDPLAQHHVMEILREVRARGSTVFFSSHNLPEVEGICDQVAIIRRGRLVAVERVEELTSRTVTRVRMTFSDAPAADAFAGVGEARETGRSDDGRRVELEIAGEVDGAIKAAARHHMVSIETERPSLEDTFLAMYKERPSADEGGDD
jgi:ABC-2 type transport system ATP-binding protein